MLRNLFTNIKCVKFVIPRIPRILRMLYLAVCLLIVTSQKCCYLLHRWTCLILISFYCVTSGVVLLQTETMTR